MPTSDKLRRLMKRNELTRARVAQLAMVADVTVDSWLAPEDSKLHRKMHPRHLALIEAALTAERARGGDRAR